MIVAVPLHSTNAVAAKKTLGQHSMSHDTAAVHAVGMQVLGEVHA